MEIIAKWSKPINLIENTSEDQIFSIDQEIPNDPGCYVFFNQHGNSFAILYIGKAKNLKARFKHQTNNLNLIKGIKDSLNEKVILLHN